MQSNNSVFKRELDSLECGKVRYDEKHRLLSQNTGEKKWNKVILSQKQRCSVIGKGWMEYSRAMKILCQFLSKENLNMFPLVLCWGGNS